MPEARRHAIRSYVIRAGRLTHGQRRATERGWPRYGLDPTGPLKLRQVFAREAPCFVEIGFGDGASLLGLAEHHPESDYIGIEVHPPGIGHLLAGLEARGLGNVRVLRLDAVEVFERYLPPASLAGVYLWFPDPWPKQRHRKRRIVQPGFAELVTATLRADGRFHLATDWEPYARQMLEVLEAESGLCNLAGAGRFHPDRDERPVTRFQRRGERLGHRVWDLIYQRQGPS